MSSFVAFARYRRSGGRKKIAGLARRPAAGMLRAGDAAEQRRFECTLQIETSRIGGAHERGTAEGAGLGRREFLVKLAAAGAALPLVPGILGAQEEEEQFDVVVARGRSLRRQLRAALAPFGGMKSFVGKGAKVVLKPNVSFRSPPEWGNVTSPKLVYETAKLCLGAGASKVTVVDHPLAGGAACFKATGLRAALSRAQPAEVLPAVERSQYAALPAREGVPAGAAKALEGVEVVKEALDADVIINIPQAKCHNATRISLGLKNLMGLVWDRAAFHQADLDGMIAALGAALRPALTILDATRALVTNGPTGPGRTETPGAVVVGTAPASVDAYAVGLARWYGRKWRPGQVRHIVEASSLGLGEIDTKKLRVKVEEA